MRLNDIESIKGMFYSRYNKQALDGLTIMPNGKHIISYDRDYPILPYRMWNLEKNMRIGKEIIFNYRLAIVDKLPSIKSFLLKSASQDKRWHDLVKNANSEDNLEKEKGFSLANQMMNVTNNRVNFHALFVYATILSLEKDTDKLAKLRKKGFIFQYIEYLVEQFLDDKITLTEVDKNFKSLEIINKDRTSIEYLSFKGKVLKEQGKYQQAENFYTQAIQHKKISEVYIYTKADIHYHRGLARLKINKKDCGCQDLVKAIKIFGIYNDKYKLIKNLLEQNCNAKIHITHSEPTLEDCYICEGTGHPTLLSRETIKIDKGDVIYTREVCGTCMGKKKISTSEKNLTIDSYQGQGATNCD